ncbi:MAG: hypothetical protein M3361_05415 [Candidatus Tectomicrobia bacterium]|nr:hypothetical protein [Candidatus Tectomicrobia bacterium]
MGKRMVGVARVLALCALLLVMVAAGERTLVSAADCDIPPFLEKGKTYMFSLMGARLSATVVDIDRQSCWVRGQWTQKRESEKELSGTTWFNVRQIVAIEEMPPAPAQARPGQRR